MISLNGIKPVTVQDPPYSHISIKIHNFNWPADAASIEKIPKHKQVFRFFNAIVDILPYNFTELFENCNKIKFLGGSVKSIHINPKLDDILLFKTSTENVIIKPDVFYKLGDFTCTKSKLTHIPENVNRLKHLTYLNLDENLIETVQMDQLNGLNNLEKLFLSSNKIKHIYSDGPVSLPSLSKMFFDKNRLQHFDVCKWDMPSLSGLHLQSNNLTHFAIHQFPALRELFIFENPVNCAWRDSINNTSTQLFFPKSCNEKSVSDFVLKCPPPNHQLQQPQISNYNSSLSQSEGKIPNSDQQFSDLSGRIQKIEEQLKNLNKSSNNHQQVSDRMQTIEEQLKNLTAMIIEQQNVSNDIIEAMYRIEVERASNRAKKIP